jgi:hypothetical protein
MKRLKKGIVSKRLLQSLWYWVVETLSEVSFIEYDE